MMRNTILLLAGFLIFTCSPALAETTYFRGYQFESYLVSESHYPAYHRGRSDYRARHVTVREGDEYSIVVRNPLPVRVAVSVSVDGLNSIDGRASNGSSGSKWIISPYGSITVKGWQVGDRGMRRFVFTKPHYSYAAWREGRDRRHYTHNLGKIRIAYFWNSAELRDVLYPPYLPEVDSPYSYRSKRRARSGVESHGLYEDKAGTGMGRHQYNPVRAVNFHYDTGMYSQRDVLKIDYSFDGDYRYDYAPRPRYNHRNRRYAPQMP